MVVDVDHVADPVAAGDGLAALDAPDVEVAGEDGPRGNLGDEPVECDGLGRGEQGEAMVAGQ